MLINKPEIPLFRPLLLLIAGIIVADMEVFHIDLKGLLVCQLVVTALLFALSHYVRRFLFIHHSYSIILWSAIFSFGFCIQQNANQHLCLFDNSEDEYRIKIEKVLPSKKHRKCIASVRKAGKNNLTSQGEEKILVYFKDLALDTTIAFGKEYRICAKLNEITPNLNPHTFNYQKYLQRLGVFHQCFIAQNDCFPLGNQQGFSLTKIAKKAANFSSNTLQSYIQDKDLSAIALAMIIGNKTQLSEKLKLLYSETGSVHVLTVSGLHVGIVAMIILFILRNLGQIINMPFWAKTSICILAVWSFAWITGAAASVIRASFMFSIYLFANQFLKRYISIYNVLYGAAFVMLLINPQQLFQVGFQLSFLAVLSIVFFFSYIKNWISTSSIIVNKLWCVVALAISAQILVFPLCMYHFNKFPVVFLVSCFVVSIAAICILGLGLVLITLESIGLDLINQIIVGPTLNKVLHLFHTSIVELSEWPFACLKNIWISELGLGVTYSLLLFFMIFLKEKNHWSFYLCLMTSLIFSSLLLWEQRLIDHQRYAIAYVSKNESLMEIYLGHDVYQISNSNKEIKDPFINEPNLIKNRIKNMRMKIDERNPHLEKDDQSLRLGNKFVILSYLKDQKELQRRPDYFFISKQSRNIQDLDPSKFASTLFVLDATLTKWEKEKSIEFLSKHQLQYYDMEKEGPMIIHF